MRLYQLIMALGYKLACFTEEVTQASRASVAAAGSLFLAGKAGKWTLSLWLGWSFAPLLLYLKEHMFHDEDFIFSLFVVIGVDTLLGVWKAWARKEISSSGFGQVITKLLVYLLVLIAVWQITRGSTNMLMGWIESAVYGMIMARELLSILENAAALGVLAPPKWLLQRLKQFDDNGQFNPPSQS